MKDLTKENIPIGPVVKKADFVFTNLARVTKNKGTFNRLEWHLINRLQEHNLSGEDEIIEQLKLLEKEDAIRNVIQRFVKEEFVHRDSGKLSLTSLGLEVFKEVSEIQNAIREKALDGITEAEYATTIFTLEKIIDNLSSYLPS